MRIRYHKSTVRMGFRVPDFSSGVLSVLSAPDDTLYKRYMRGSVAGDIRKNWKTVGNDIRAAIKEYRNVSKNGREK